MSSFKGSEFNIAEEKAGANDSRVVKTEVSQPHVVQDFSFRNIRTAGAETRFRPSMIPTENRKDPRFTLSQLSREALAAGREEERIFEAKVNDRVAELTAIARADGFKQGFDQGKREGHDQAFSQFQAEATEKLARAEAVISLIENAKLELFEKNKEFLTNLFYRIAKVVLLRESAMDKEYLLRLARELIEKTNLKENLTFKIHPNDAEAVDSLREGLMKNYSTLKNLSIEVSEHVEEGGCVLETEWGVIDATLETQLAQILKAIGDPTA